MIEENIGDEDGVALSDDDFDLSFVMITPQ